MDTLGERLNYVRKKTALPKILLLKLSVYLVVLYLILKKNKTEPQAIVINAICQILKINKDWLISGTGEMENSSEVSQSAKILAELYEVAKSLSEEEQLYLLDTVKALKQPLGSLA